MTTYRISAESARTEKTKAFRRSAFISTAALMVGFLVGGRWLFQEKNPTHIFITVSVFGAFFAFAILLSLRRLSRFLADAYSSFEIIADEQTLTKKQKNTPDVTLTRSEIQRIEELQGKGFRMCTADRNRNIWVPCELEGYEQLKAEIVAPAGTEFTSKQAAWLKTYLVLAAFFGLFVVSVLATDKRIGAGASTALGGWLVSAFFRYYWNPNLTAKGRRQFLLGAFVGVCFLVRAVLVWRG